MQGMNGEVKFRGDGGQEQQQKTGPEQEIGEGAVRKEKEGYSPAKMIRRISMITRQELRNRIRGVGCKQEPVQKTSSNNAPFATSWQVVMGVVALLDFLSTLANRRLFKHIAKKQDDDSEEAHHFRMFSHNLPLHQLITRIFLWLDAYSIQFGVLFSVLWAIDAFRIADKAAEKALSENDRQSNLLMLRQTLNQQTKKQYSSSPRYERYMTYTY